MESSALLIALSKTLIQNKYNKNNPGDVYNNELLKILLLFLKEQSHLLEKNIEPETLKKLKIDKLILEILELKELEIEKQIEPLKETQTENILEELKEHIKEYENQIIINTQELEESMEELIETLETLEEKAKKAELTQEDIQVKKELNEIRKENITELDNRITSNSSILFGSIGIIAIIACGNVVLPIAASSITVFCLGSHIHSKYKYIKPQDVATCPKFHKKQI